MSMHIVGSVDKDRVYCAGSFTKMLTTYVTLSLLAEKSDIKNILDDDNFFDAVCVTKSANDFLKLFQKIIGSKFSIRDICSYYSGLPYTFGLADEELASVESGNPFKHHSIPSEEEFLSRCKENITLVYPNRSKFHYSEIAILFLGYLIEKIYDVKFEDLYHQYIIDKYKLTKSKFSRTKVSDVYIQDLSDEYDYPSIAILDHGYFCYSNGYYTTLNDMKTLIENLLNEPVFNYMTDIEHARAASNKIMNGLTVELRMVKDDIIYGYEGLSFSGCNIWAYSTKQKKGYITFDNSEERVYDVIYGQLGYDNFDIAPNHTQEIYKKFIATYHEHPEDVDVPIEYQGKYQRVKINEKSLLAGFSLGKDFMVIRNPDEIKYDLIYVKGDYRVKGKDNLHGATVGLHKSQNGNYYMIYDGTLYKKIE